MNDTKSKKHKRIKLIIIITALILFYIIIFFFFRFKLSHLSQMMVKVEYIYSTYGYLLIFLGALIEGTFIVGFYIPGSLIVLLGVSLARLGITSFPLVVLFGTLGFCLGYTINYFLGRYGWFRIIDAFGLEKQITETKKKLLRHYNKSLFWGYMMASSGSIVSTASGILKIPFKEFILKTLAIQFFWSLFLGGLAFTFGMTFINIFLIYFGSIAILSLVLFLLHNILNKTDTKNKTVIN